MATENIFIKGIRNILRKSRPILWRELYHTMHTIDTDRIFPMYYAIWLHIKLGFLATQRGRHTKKLVKEIRKNLFSALVNHADQNTIENYHIATLEEKQNLAYYVTWRLHSAMTYTHPNIYDNLQEIKFYNSEKYKLKNKKPAPYGEYYVSKRLIYYYSGVFEMDLTDLLNVIVHEYIHAMRMIPQDVVRTSSDKDARLLLGALPNDVTLHLEQGVVAQRIVQDRLVTRYRTPKITQQRR